MEAELEQRRELEEEAAEGGGGEFDLQRRQPPRLHNNVSTTTVTINGMSTRTASLSSSSESYSPGGDFSQLVEGGEFSYESFALTSGEVNFNDSNKKSTTPGTVMVDIATESFGIETTDELFKWTDPPPSNKNSSIQEQIAAETSIDIGAIEQEGRVRSDIREEIEEQKEIRDLYLETVYKKPATSDFYCPNCQACIDKVLIRRRLEEEELRCPSCFAFLKPLGDWFFRKPVPRKPVPTQVPGIKEPTDQPKPVDAVHPPPPPLTPMAQKTPEQPGIKEPTDQPKPVDAVHPPPPPLTPMAQKTPEQPGIKEPTDQPKPVDAVHPPPPPLTPMAQKTPEQPGNKEPTSQLEPGDTLYPPVPFTGQSTPEQDGTIKLEIVKSLVYGGLTESITSLSVVTSAASAAASTLSIVVLALANLIGGLFIIGHNVSFPSFLFFKSSIADLKQESLHTKSSFLYFCFMNIFVLLLQPLTSRNVRGLRDLKNEQSRVTLNEAEEQVDRYLQVLGQKKNFIIHASVAVLSFLVCGLLPPVVYGLSFYKSDNSYLKLAVVAATSLICITILALAKAYIKKPTRWYMYLRTVSYYVSLGVGASGISYLAGYLFKLLADKLGWFESSAAVTLSLPGMSSVPSAQVSSY